ncbi:CehA/McbA family metallohydrolase [Candidatus Altiarchaeota archaeon]
MSEGRREFQLGVFVVGILLILLASSVGFSILGAFKTADEIPKHMQGATPPPIYASGTVFIEFDQPHYLLGDTMHILWDTHFEGSGYSHVTRVEIRLLDPSGSLVHTWPNRDPDSQGEETYTLKSGDPVGNWTVEMWGSTGNVQSPGVVPIQGMVVGHFGPPGGWELISDDTAEVNIPPVPWWKGNTHTHSTLSDGDSTPSSVASHYRILGYDFLVLTDHNIVSNFEQYSVPGEFLCINGEEMTPPTDDHVNGMGLTSPITPGTIQENVDAVLAQGGLATVNHLNSSGLGVDDLLPIEGLKFIEVHNAKTNDYDEDVWDGLLSERKLIYGIASDDCHILGSEAGKAWIMVRSDTLTLESIQEAIDSGEFYASNGVILDDYIVEPDRMIVDSQNGDQIEFIGLNGQVLETHSYSYAEYVFQGTEDYVRARITNNEGEYAWTQPIFLEGFVE